MIDKIIFDCDGVILDSNKVICKMYNEKFKNHIYFKKANHNEIKRWDYKDQCPLENNIPNYFGQKEFFENVEFIPKSKEIIKKLSKNNNIYICTKGILNNIAYKSFFLKEHMPFIKNIIFMYNEGSFTDKSIINMKNSIFIDDNANNLESSNAKIKICFGNITNYNKNWTGLRAINYDKLYNIIMEVIDNNG